MITRLIKFFATSLIMLGPLLDKLMYLLSIPSANSKQKLKQTGGGEVREKGKRKREEEREPVGIRRYFDCSSIIIYSGPSFNYSNVRNNNNNKNINCVA